MYNVTIRSGRDGWEEAASGWVMNIKSNDDDDIYSKYKEQRWVTTGKKMRSSSCPVVSHNDQVIPER
jgi:hypothetical protein